MPKKYSNKKAQPFPAGPCHTLGVGPSNNRYLILFNYTKIGLHKFTIRAFKSFGYFILNFSCNIYPINFNNCNPLVITNITFSVARYITSSTFHYAGRLSVK